MSEFRRRLMVAGLSTAGLVTALSAQARADLSVDQHITGSLLSAAIGAMIAHECPEIEPRRLFALMKAWELKNYALRQGHTEEEIDAYLDSREEQRRYRRAAEAYLIGQGVDLDEPQSFCKAGAAEIAKKTLAGRLIRQN